jgi:hypothetical protein
LQSLWVGSNYNWIPTIFQLIDPFFFFNHRL